MDTESQFRELKVLQQTDHDTLIRVESKVDGFSVEIKRISIEILERLSDHESRIRLLEKNNELYNGKSSYSSKLIIVGLSFANILIGGLAIYFGLHR